MRASPKCERPFRVYYIVQSPWAKPTTMVSKRWSMSVETVLSQKVKSVAVKLLTRFRGALLIWALDAHHSEWSGLDEEVDLPLSVKTGWTPECLRWRRKSRLVLLWNNWLKVDQLLFVTQMRIRSRTPGRKQHSFGQTLRRLFNRFTRFNRFKNKLVGRRWAFSCWCLVGWPLERCCYKGLELHMRWPLSYSGCEGLYPCGKCLRYLQGNQWASFQLG